MASLAHRLRRITTGGGTTGGGTTDGGTTDGGTTDGGTTTTTGSSRRRPISGAGDGSMVQ